MAFPTHEQTIKKHQRGSEQKNQNNNNKQASKANSTESSEVLEQSYVSMRPLPVGLFSRSSAGRTRQRGEEEEEEEEEEERQRSWELKFRSVHVCCVKTSD